MPLFRHSEIWLTSLVSLKAQVIRMGIKEDLIGIEESPEEDLDCFFSSRAALWSERGLVTKKWIQQMAITQCKENKLLNNNNVDTCRVEKLNLT